MAFLALHLAGPMGPSPSAGQQQDEALYYVYVGAESADLLHRIRFGPGGAELDRTDRGWRDGHGDRGPPRPERLPRRALPLHDHGPRRPRRQALEVPRRPRHPRRRSHPPGLLPRHPRPHPRWSLRLRGQLQPARRHGAVHGLGGLHAGHDRGGADRDLHHAARGPPRRRRRVPLLGLHDGRPDRRDRHSHLRGRPPLLRWPPPARPPGSCPPAAPRRSSWPATAATASSRSTASRGPLPAPSRPGRAPTTSPSRPTRGSSSRPSRRVPRSSSSISRRGAPAATTPVLDHRDPRRRRQPPTGATPSSRWKGWAPNPARWTSSIWPTSRGLPMSRSGSRRAASSSGRWSPASAQPRAKLAEPNRGVVFVPAEVVRPLRAGAASGRGRCCAGPRTC